MLVATTNFPTIVDLGELDNVAGAAGKQPFSFKNLRNWTAVGFGAGAAGGAVGCLATGPAYPACVGLSALGGATSAAIWNVASQTGVLDQR